MNDWAAHHKPSRKVIVIAAALITFSLLMISGHAAMARQLHRWRVLPEPERLTELYFANAAALPKTYAPGQEQTVAFTVHNLERQTTAYRYVVTVGGGTTTSSIMASGSLILMNGQWHTVLQPIVMPAAGAQARVSVTLANIPETISYTSYERTTP